MRLVLPGKILFFVFLLLLSKQVFAQSASQVIESPNFVSATVPSQEFQRRNLSWEVEHPELATTRVVTRGELPGAKTVTLNFRVTYPTLDIFSAAGVPVYFSDSSEASLKVIDSLPLVMPEADLDPRYKVRPSLREALSMVPGISRSDWATPSQIDYTVVAVSWDRTANSPLPPKEGSAGRAKNRATYVQNMNSSGPAIRVIEAPASPEDVQRSALARQANAAANQAQDEAIQRLKTRLSGSRIRVIEIRLMEP